MWENVYTDVIVAGAAGGMGLFLNSIRTSVRKLTGKVDTLSGDVSALDDTVKGHTQAVREITLCNSVMTRIDIKIQQALEYLDKDDTAIAAFVHSQGDMAKDCIQWAIHNDMKVTEAEVRAKFETLIISIRDLLTTLPPEFSNKIRPLLREIATHHINRAVFIAADTLFNSKVDRFFTLTEQTMNEILTSIIRTRIENKIR